MSNFSRSLFIFALFYCIKVQATIPDLCNLPKDEGIESEKDVQVYLYYNQTADKCYPFRYKGQGGNENRFNYEFYCMRNCSTNAEKLYPINRTLACQLPKTPGDCYGHYLRYYYDAVRGKCMTFYWTGCVGNGNRFLDFEHCNATCFGILDSKSNGNSEEETDTPAGIILGVVLGVTGAIILITVLVLAVKKKKPSKSRINKAKETKLKEDTNTPEPEVPLRVTETA